MSAEILDAVTDLIDESSLLGVLSIEVVCASNIANDRLALNEFEIAVLIQRHLAKGQLRL